MDIFVCNDNMVQVPDDRECMNDSWLTDDGPCYALLWAYDKGALSPHRLPNDAGFRVGQGTPYTRLALQIHYLLPEVPSEWSSGGAAAPASSGDVTLLRASELIDANYRDTSGIVVNLSPILRPHNAWSFEFMAYNMRIEPGATHLEYANRLPKAKVREILGTDLRYGNGSITLRQVHAHAHNHAVRVALLRMRDGEEPQTLYQIEPYCGYGDCQHFHNIPSQPTLMEGDELEFRCTYENHDRFVLGYGLSAMKEMCGPIIIYTPHDYGQRPRKTWYDHDDGRMRDDRFPEEEEDPEAGWTQSPMMNGHQEDFPTALARLYVVLWLDFSVSVVKQSLSTTHILLTSVGVVHILRPWPCASSIRQLLPLQPTPDAPHGWAALARPAGGAAHFRRLRECYAGCGSTAAICSPVGR